MSHVTTCPHCSTRFNVPEGITNKTLICPHCHADVDNAWPGSQIRAADINTNVKRGWNVGCIVITVLIGLCFLGIARVDYSGSKGEKRTPQLLLFAALVVLVNIPILRGLVRKRDSSVGSIVLAALIALCVLGITVLFIASAFSSTIRERGPFLLVYPFVPLDLLVIIALLRGLDRWGTSGVRVPSVGRTLGIMFLSFGTIIAVISFFFFTCIFPFA